VRDGDVQSGRGGKKKRTRVKTLLPTFRTYRCGGEERSRPTTLENRAVAAEHLLNCREKKRAKSRKLRTLIPRKKNSAT